MPQTSKKYDYDLVVIGGGSGGLAASKVSAVFRGYFNGHDWFLFFELKGIRRVLAVMGNSSKLYRITH